MAAAQTADGIAADNFHAIAEKLVLTQAATTEGVMAKARATANFFGENVSVECLRSELRDFGPDDNMVSWSLALDIMRLAKSEGVAR